MNILMVVAEYAPLAKTGGLADASAGLSEALIDNGHDVRVLLPAYAHIDRHHSEPLRRQPTADGGLRLRALTGAPGRAKIYLSEVPALDGVEGIYSGDDRDAWRFIALAEAAPALIECTAWHPDVVHGHDWHAGLVPAALVANSLPIPTVLSLHNIGYQGVFSRSVLARHEFAHLASAIPAAGPNAADVNFLRTGIATASRICTVSPTYAREILTPESGMGLDDILGARRNALSGILNGVDYSIWDPRNDPYIQAHYGTPAAPEKLTIKHGLCRKLGLPRGDRAPVIGLVSRLAEQKGIDLLVSAFPQLLRQTDAMFAILGSGEAPLEQALSTLARQHPERLAFKAGYDERLAHEIVAGSDLFVVPSRYEPCGLTQMYALRYGTIPVVRRTGGLADTIEPFDPRTLLGNGVVFDAASASELRDAILTGIEYFADADLRQAIRKNGMGADHSWQRRLPDYESLYGAAVSRE